MSQPPLLSAEDARIAVDGAVVIDRLTFEAHGDRVLLAGDPGALVAALTGVPLSAAGGARRGRDEEEDEEMPGHAQVVAGAVRLAGRNVAEGAHLPVMGSAPLDPPLPPGWTAIEYVSWGARLAGIDAGAAIYLALAALTTVGLRDARKKRLAALTLPERRALSLAQAAVTSPEVIVAEAPLSGLEGPAADFVVRAVAAVTEGRLAVLSASRLDPGSPEGVLARTASHLVVLAGRDVALEGPPSELFSGATIYSLTVHSNVGPFRDELTMRGIDLHGGPRKFSAALPPGATTREILLAAHAARAAVVELVPVIG